MSLLKCPNMKFFHYKVKLKVLIFHLVFSVIKQLIFAVSCGSQQFRKSIKENSKKTKCKPRDSIVDIKYKEAIKVRFICEHFFQF